jgi:hypothetical protein
MEQSQRIRSRSRSRDKLNVLSNVIKFKTKLKQKTTLSRLIENIDNPVLRHEEDVVDFDNTNTRLLVLDMIRHGVETNNNVVLPPVENANTHILRISIIPTMCLMPTEYSVKLQHVIPMYFRNLFLENKELVINYMKQREGGYELLKQLVEKIVSELRDDVSECIRTYGRIQPSKKNPNTKKIKICNSLSSEMCDITSDLDVVNKKYWVGDLSEDKHSIIRVFDTIDADVSLEYFIKENIPSEISTNGLVCYFRNHTEMDKDLWIILIDSSCNMLTSSETPISNFPCSHMGGKRRRKKQKTKKQKTKK